MPAHSTCEDALASVAAFSAAVKAQPTSQDKQKGSKAKHKHKHKHKDRREDADKPKDNKNKKSKQKSKGHRKASSSDLSDSKGTAADTLEDQLMRSRNAVRNTRGILAQHQDVREDLRELLRRVDAGEALELGGIPDLALQQRLRELFGELRMSRTRKGVYLKRPGAPAALDLLGGVIAETLAVLATKPPQGQSQPLQKPAGAQESGVHVTGPSPGSAVPPQSTSKSGPGDVTHDILTRILPDAGIIPVVGLPLTNGHLAEAPEASEATSTDSPAGAASMQPSIGPEIGPQAMPLELHQNGNDNQNGANHVHAEVISDAAAAVGNGLDGVDQARQEDHEAAPARRVIGPAVPPADLLAAAAEAAEEMAALAELDDLMVGPVPPDIGAEADAASSDVRSAEVSRILRVIDDHKRGIDESHLKKSTDVSSPDAYLLLGVDPTASASDIKKRYWRLSLLTHPDKCPHPQAHAAFDAVSQAAKALQDAQQRAAIDKTRQDARDMQQALAAAADDERARQWRIVQGKATPEDLAGPVRGPQPLERGAWMTELPEERRPNATPSQKPQTSFASQGVMKRGDTTSWTDTPQQKLMRLQRGYEETAAALPSSMPDAQQKPSSQTMQAIEGFNAKHRAKTLLEQHQDKLKKTQVKERKERKRKAPEVQGSADQSKEWAGAHPWRPFDREKDMQAGPKLVTKEDMVKKAGSLSGRFASG